MTYDDAKGELGRKPVTIVELELPRCLRAYGSAPCTAAVGVTGTKRCFNTRATCQDPDNYDDTATTTTYRFTSRKIKGLQQSGDLPCFPCLADVSFTPTQLDPGRSLGLRSAVTLKLADFVWGDVGTDPYLSSRAYDPTQQGTFFGKLMARVQYLENRKLTVRTGFLDDDGEYDSANFITREFRTDRWSGPDERGTVSIRGKDLLKAADNLKAQIPAPSEGALLADINDSTTTIPLGSGQAAEYSVDDYVRVDDEVMLVTAVDLVADELTVTRATLPAVYVNPNMIAEDHKADAVVQLCYFFDSQRVDDVVYELLVNWANIDTSYITFADWQTEADDWFATYDFSALITEPTGVQTLLTEICMHNIVIWWDERDQEIKFKALQPFPKKGIPTYTDDANIVADSVSSTRNTSGRISQCWMYYGMRNPVEPLDEPKNYQGLHAIADLDSETDEQYGERQIFKIFSRWVASTDLNLAIDVTGRMLAEYRDTKTIVALSVDVKDDDRWTGDQIMLQTRYFQDDEGASNPRPFQIIEAVQQGGPERATTVALKLQATRANGRCAIIGPNTQPDYLAATLDERLYGFIASAVAKMSNGEDGYYIC